MAWNITNGRTMTPALEILVQQVNVDVAASVVLDASTVTADPNGDLVVKAGTPLKKVGNQYSQWKTADGTTNPIRGILSADIYFVDNTTKSDQPATMWNHGQWFRTDRIIGWGTDGAAIQAALPTCKFS